MRNTDCYAGLIAGAAGVSLSRSTCGEIRPQSDVLPSAEEQRSAVAIIDQRTLTREGLVQLLESTGKFSTVAVANVAELLAKQGETGFRETVILFSLGSTLVGDQSVSSDIAALLRTYPNWPVIVICDRDDSQQAGEAFRQGARGFVPTTLTARILIEAMRLVQAGGTFVPASAFTEALTRRAERLDPASDVLAPSLSGLTPRQREVLNLLRCGKPNKIIAYELSMCESTVKVHVRQIMRKLRASNRTQAAFLVSSIAEQASG